MPIIIGTGQCVDKWDGKDPIAAPSPQALLCQAANNALVDASSTTLVQHIDWVGVVRLFADSLPMAFYPFGRVENYPQLLAEQLGISKYSAIYSTAGGEQPQSLVNELSAALHSGQYKMGLIAGSEATQALKLALKNQHQLNWEDKASTPVTEAYYTDRGAQTDFISEYEIINGMGMPPQTYALMEQALRGRLGMSQNEYCQLISTIFARFSSTAATNPYAQFPQARSAEFLATPSAENYPVCDPYLKWHVAQDAVNQGAALLMTTTNTARELGIPEHKWVYLHGHSELKDKMVSERPDISKSLALELAINSALKHSGISVKQLTTLDIYSCFPIVVMLAAEILGLNPTETNLTVTGGLPFFGGAGNNYSTHAIASMVEQLRSKPNDYGLVVANGGFMSKEAAGVYSCQAPTSWQPFEVDSLAQQIEAQPSPKLLKQDCTATVTAYGIRHARNKVDHLYIVADNNEGRVMAKVAPDDDTTMTALSNADELLGKSLTVTHKQNENIIIESFA